MRRISAFSLLVAVLVGCADHEELPVYPAVDTESWFDLGGGNSLAPEADRCVEGQCSGDALASYLQREICKAFAVSLLSRSEDIAKACTGHTLLAGATVAAIEEARVLGRVREGGLERCRKSALLGGTIHDCLGELDLDECAADPRAAEGDCPCSPEEGLCLYGRCARVWPNRNNLRTVSGIGESCRDQPCATGLGCIGAVCTVLPDLGELCTETIGCLRGACQNGACTGLPLGTPCEPARGFQAGSGFMETCSPGLSCDAASRSCRPDPRTSQPARCAPPPR